MAKKRSDHRNWFSSPTTTVWKIRHSIFLALVLLFGTFEFAIKEGAAQTPRDYTDYRNNTVSFPLGVISFADSVSAFQPGTPTPPKTESDPNAALGEPDYKSAGDGRAFSLGCRGWAVFEFTDNAVIDVPGTDLYIFEVGKDVEPTDISLSKDGKNWSSIGRIEGGRTSIDLAKHGLAGREYRFVRLQDTGKSCAGRWPGADIDAIGAIGAANTTTASDMTLSDQELSVMAGAYGLSLSGGHMLDVFGKTCKKYFPEMGHEIESASSRWSEVNRSAIKIATEVKVRALKRVGAKQPRFAAALDSNIQAKAVATNKQFSRQYRQGLAALDKHGRKSSCEKYLHAYRDGKMDIKALMKPAGYRQLLQLQSMLKTNE